MTLTTTINPSWREFWCKRCQRLISSCIPAGTDPGRFLPTVEYIESCALCSRDQSKRP